MHVVLDGGPDSLRQKEVFGGKLCKSIETCIRCDLPQITLASCYLLRTESLPRRILYSAAVSCSFVNTVSEIVADR